MIKLDKKLVRTNCLSIFKNHFSSPTMSWAYDQKNIAEQYILYSRLMDYWKSKYKDDIFDANYEHPVTYNDENLSILANKPTFGDDDTFEIQCYKIGMKKEKAMKRKRA